jgi:creatinine amidohydrolase
MAANTSANDSPPPSGVLLADLTWLEAEKVLTPQTVVVIPLGAASKEHGPHLPLNNDLIMAEYFKNRVLAAEQVVIAPTINYHFFPAFLEYPGSVSLRAETARDLVIDICRSLARYGPRRFYVLNTGVSTMRPLRAAAEILANEEIMLHFTDMIRIAAATKDSVRKQEGGTHADEIETSMMLYISPASVKMSKAVKDYQPDKGNLTRNPQTEGTYSASGIWGDPTLATTAKGEKIVEAMVKEILQDIGRLRQTKLPTTPSLSK